MKSELKKAWGELPTDVQQELSSLSTVPQPDPQSRAARRDAFLMSARAMAPQQPLPAPKSLKERIAALWPSRTLGSSRQPFPALVRALLLSLLIVGSLAGTVAAAQYSLPGSLLYPFKLQLEDWRLAVTRQPENEAQLAMDMAQERVEEALALTDQDTQVPSELAERYEQQLALALQATGEVTGPVRTALEHKFHTTVTQQLQAAEAVMAQQRADADVPPDSSAVQAMIRTMEMASVQIHSGMRDEVEVPIRQRACTMPDGRINPVCVSFSDQPSNPSEPSCSCAEGEPCACEGGASGTGPAADATKGSPGAGPGPAGSDTSPTPSSGSSDPGQSSGDKNH